MIYPIFGMIFFSIFVIPALADTKGVSISDGLKKSKSQTQFVDQDSPDVLAIVASIVRTVLGTIGIVALIVVVYAGVMYLTSAGSPEKVKKALAILLYSVIGLAIIFGAYTLTDFVLKNLQGVTIGTKPG